MSLPQLLLVWTVYLGSVVGAIVAHQREPRVVYGVLSWVGGATFILLAIELQHRLNRRRDRRARQHP